MGKLRIHTETQNRSYATASNLANTISQQGTPMPYPAMARGVETKTLHPAPYPIDTGANAPASLSLVPTELHPIGYTRIEKYIRTKMKAQTQRHQSILLYHDVAAANLLANSGFSGKGAEVYKLETASFDAHLRALKEAFPHGPQLPNVESQNFMPTLILTFDDGGHTALTEVAPRLEALGWRGVFFITTGYIGTPGFLTAADIRELHRRGHMIGSHSVTHPGRMSALPYAALLQEWAESLRTLSDIVGAPVQVASVPGGYCSREVIQAAEAAGVTMLMTSEPSRRVTRYGRTTVVGRFCVKQDTRAATAAALAGRSLLVQRRQWLRWNILKILKYGLGSAYPFLREVLLNRVRR